MTEPEKEQQIAVLNQKILQAKAEIGMWKIDAKQARKQARQWQARMALYQGQLRALVDPSSASTPT